jgi:hypothetical protein
MGMPISWTARFISLRNYLYYSTILGIFSAILTFHVGVNIPLFDLLMLVNFLPIFLLTDFTRVPVWMLCLAIYLALSGGIGIVNGTDSISLAAKEFFGIFVSIFYFYYFFKVVRNDFERAFLTYTRVSYWFCIIAFPLWIVSCAIEQTFVRLQSLTPEPAAFCTLILPAYYWFVHQYFTNRKHAIEVVVITLAVILSGSSLGFISVAFGVVLLMSGRRKLIVAIPIVIAGLLGLAYAVSHDFQVRLNDTVLAATSEDVSGANLSTYALVSNMIVTQQVLKESPILGNGLGSHPISHERYIGDIPGIEVFVQQGMENLNAAEAASFTLRSLSELGILGFLGVLVFLFHFHVGGTGPRAAISNAILVCFFLKLIRGGMYFPPEQFFFVFIYILNYRNSTHEAGLNIPRSSAQTALPH